MEIGVWKMVRAHESDDSIRYGNVFTYLYVFCYVYKITKRMEIGSGKIGPHDLHSIIIQN